MKKKKLERKYNELAVKYNELLNEIENLLDTRESLENSLAKERVEKEEILGSFVAMKDQYCTLLDDFAKIKKERDMYRCNYGELFTLAVNARELTKGENFIKSIDFSDDVTTINWADNTTTSVKRHQGEKHDTHTAVAYAIAKRSLGTTSIDDVVKYYQEDHSKDAKYLRIYRALNSKSPMQRIKAQKAWEKIPKSKRQSIKAMAKKV